MALQEDNTIIDDREPVTFARIREENLPIPIEDLQKAGTDITKTGLGEEEFADRIGLIDAYLKLGIITPDEARRRKKQLRSNREESVEQSRMDGRVVMTLKYDQPNVSVDTGARFTEHESIDGPIVRQRIGPGLVEVSVEGVCTTAEAGVLDNLRHENKMLLLSDRFSGTVQIAAISTGPLEDGGAIDLDGQFTHTFGLELVEVQ